MKRLKRTRRRNETGAVGGVEGLAFGVLIFVFGTLLVTNTWAVIDSKLTATAAAREAARTYVEAPDSFIADERARAAALSAVGSTPRLVDVTLSGATTSTTFDRCGQVTATVRLYVPRIALPAIGGTGGTIAVTARHTERIDPYRSGLHGAADCR